MRIRLELREIENTKNTPIEKIAIEVNDVIPDSGVSAQAIEKDTSSHSGHTSAGSDVIEILQFVADHFDKILATIGALKHFWLSIFGNAECIVIIETDDLKIEVKTKSPDAAEKIVRALSEIVR